jgi:hypothetical protein
MYTTVGLSDASITGNLRGGGDLTLQAISTGIHRNSPFLSLG